MSSYLDERMASVQGSWAFCQHLSVPAMTLFALAQTKMRPGARAIWGKRVQNKSHFCFRQCTDLIDLFIKNSCLGIMFLQRDGCQITQSAPMDRLVVHYVTTALSD